MIVEPTSMDVPKFLFRYLRDDSRLVETLTTPYLWFSAPAALNDPFDLTNVFEFSGTTEEVISYVRRALQRYPELANESAWRRAIESDERLFFEVARKAAADLHRVYLEKVGLCCFSFEPDVPLMWSHYSGGHSGICLVIETTPRLLVDYSLIGVRYQSPLPKWNMVTNRLNYGTSLLFAKNFDQIVLGTKYLDWAYEHEYRLISRQRGKHVINSEMVVGVILGAKMSNERKVEIAAILAERLPNATVVEAALDLNTGTVAVPVFENSLLHLPIATWRLLDDEPGEYRDVPVGKPIDFPFEGVHDRSFGSLQPHSQWQFNFRLKAFDPSFVTPSNPEVDYEFDAVVMGELTETHRPDEAFLMPKPGCGVESAISPKDHVAAIINLTLAALPENERQAIEIGADYVFCWSGEPGYQIKCSRGTLDIIAVAARVEFTYLTCQRENDEQPDPGQSGEDASTALIGKEWGSVPDESKTTEDTSISAVRVVTGWSREGFLTKPVRVN